MPSPTLRPGLPVGPLLAGLAGALRAAVGTVPGRSAHRCCGKVYTPPASTGKR